MMEMLVALVLSLVLLAAALPLWNGITSRTSDAQERLVQLQRWQVVAARLERDLRLASADGVAGLGCAPIIEARPNKVTLVTRTADGTKLELVSWEIVGGSLMRRRNPLDYEGAGLPVGPFSDNKTMLEGVREGSFGYRLRAAVVGGFQSAGALSYIDAVSVRCEFVQRRDGPGDIVEAGARIGR
jgi:type II secretory pathway component PulJ